MLVETAGTDNIIIEWVHFALSEVVGFTDAGNEF